MEVEKKIHRLWKEGNKAGLKLVGKWHYVYSSKKGKISLVKFINYFHDGKDFWEIYCIKGNLIDDIERFPTKKEAEERIKQLLSK